MEFVLVTFPETRSVNMDGITQGQTGQVIGVQRGVHIFDLGMPLDYAPPSVQIAVANTSAPAPLVIPFQSLAFAAAPPMAEAPTRRRAAGKKSARKKASPKKKPAAKRKAPLRRKATGRKKGGRTPTRKKR